MLCESVFFGYDFDGASEETLTLAPQGPRVNIALKCKKRF